MATISYNEFLKQSGGGKDSIKSLGFPEPEKEIEQPSYSSGVMERLNKNAENLGQDYLKRGEGITNAIGSTISRIKEPGTGLVEDVANVGLGLGKIGGEVVKGTYDLMGGIAGFFGSLIPQNIRDNLSEEAQKIITEDVMPTVTSAKEKINTSQNPDIIRVRDNIKNLVQIAKDNPDVTESATNLINTLLLGSLNKASPNVPGLKNTLGTVKSDIGAGVSNIKNAIPNVRPAIEKTGQVLKGAGESAYGLTVTPTEATAKSLLSYDAKQPTMLGRLKNFFTGKSGVGTKPITEASTAARQGLAGTEYQIGVQSKRGATRLWEKVLAPKLDAIKTKVSMKNFFADLRKDIIRNTKDLGRRTDLLEALEAFKEPYKNVDLISFRKLQQYKEGWAEFIPEATYKGKPIASSLKAVKDLGAGKARTQIYEAIGADGKLAYLDYGNLQSIIEAGAKSITGDAAKKTLGRNIWQFIMDKAVTPVATISGKVLYRTGEGLEFIGKNGAKTVKDIMAR